MIGEKRLDELHKVAKPLVRWLRKNCSPHSSILVEYTLIRIISEEAGVPVKEAEEGDTCDCGEGTLRFKEPDHIKLWCPVCGEVEDEF